MSNREQDFKDIWSIIEEEKLKAIEDKSDETKSQETNVFFIGCKNSGKTTLILKFLEREETPKPTTGLEYTYGRRTRGMNLAKDVAHLWELGGGTFLSQLLNIPLTTDTISNSSVLIILDLSKPDELWDVMESLINELRSRIKSIVSDLRSTNPAIVTDLRRKAKEKHGAGHPDEPVLTPLPIPVAFIGTKYDVFQDFDPEKKKIISRTLRFVAHKYGASLYYFSNKSETLVTRCRQVITHFAFNGPLNQAVSMDYNKPLIVPVGSDSIGQIGIPSLSSGDDLAKIGAESKSPFDVWKQAYCGFFPQAPKDHQIFDDPCKDLRYKEPSIDSMRSQKDEELERYKKECERKARQREQAKINSTGKRSS
ncbi:PREDICTED: cytoplasmic dynein 2 light intermediate chain 1-like isoform X1 [Amphimedon queenslandica]|uniref:Cytoplasmic dynein 2 light intermediate chain 1 n=1 Tax=Amphimedon queenslandica TaxID=400682 RepID=A0A1X7U6T1_AMPQE|nr:PREDICTED: cytoplasmic dynein 2 light intermediate chain 1-like isoform X1 [Amphimedon queenslandica]|eukprot:XP_019855996.1 PREDICTED: cytoplasmic dynein 2 light intermediate chain 1-like isoform X1 [Amphimedon queenslandica]